MTDQKPSVGRIVHYVSRGSKDNVFPATCRAAIVTDVPDPEQPLLIGLAVLNPSGLFFDQGLSYDDGQGTPGDKDCFAPHEKGPFNYCGVCDWTAPQLIGGTWHWPERTN